MSPTPQAVRLYEQFREAIKIVERAVEETKVAERCAKPAQRVADGGLCQMELGGRARHAPGFIHCAELVRTKSGMSPTPQAVRLYEQFREAIKIVERAVEADGGLCQMELGGRARHAPGFIHCAEHTYERQVDHI
jgi:DNA-binding transcriptional LysR family regulator